MVAVVAVVAVVAGEAAGPERVVANWEVAAVAATGVSVAFAEAGEAADPDS